MRVIYKKIPFKKINCVATIGVFDGIHLGHKFILKKLRKKARELNVPSLVITFDIPPQILLQKKHKTLKEFPGFLTNLKDKACYLSKEGIDYVWFLKTNNALFGLSGRQFLDYLFRYFTVKHFILGKDFRFGHNGSANIRYLKKISKHYGFRITILKKIEKTGNTVSSSLIRQLIKKSRFKKVENLLGRRFYIEGRVIKGLGNGTKLGYPTINIDYGGYVIPQEGVYAACVEIDKKKYLSAASIGVRATVVESREKILEAHILNFKGNILEKKVRISFIKKLRNQRKFSSVKELKISIAKDVSCIKKHFRV